MKGRTRIGLWMMAAGVLALSAPVWPGVWARAAQAGLEGHPRVQALVMAASRAQRKGLRSQGAVAAPKSSVPLSGQPVAVLRIPTISVDATIVAGTTDWNLASAPGWVMSTALPGQAGTAVVAAHNATFFRHLNRLQPGAVINVTTDQGTFQFTVTRHAVVRTGSLVINTVRPTLVLEACYPLDALYLTPYRYLVYAKLAQSRLAPTSLPAPSSEWPYQAAIPASVSARYPLGLSQNSLQMGTLSYQAPNTSGTQAFESSSVPYDVTAEVLRLFFAARDLSAVRNEADYRAMLTDPGAALPFFWGRKISPSGPADVRISLSAAGAPTAVTLSLGTISAASGPVSVTMRVAIVGHRLLLNGFSNSPG